MNELFELIKDNQFAAGGMATVALSSLLYVLRSIPLKIFKLVHSKMCLTLHVDNNSSQNYQKVGYWVCLNVKKLKSVDLEEDVPRMGYTTHYF